MEFVKHACREFVSSPPALDVRNVFLIFLHGFPFMDGVS
jgi:hypothetical protein